MPSQKLSNTFYGILELRSNINRASTYEAMGERQHAIDDLQHFLTLQPEESWAQIARDMLRQWDPDLS